MNKHYHFYYDTEKAECEQVYLHDYGGSYEFDIIAVYKYVPTNKFYWGTDSGCSCHSPFEDLDKIADLEELTDKTFPEFRSAFLDHHHAHFLDDCHDETSDLQDSLLKSGMDSGLIKKHLT